MTKEEIYKKRCQNKHGTILNYPIITKGMREFHTAVAKIWHNEQRCCSLKEIREIMKIKYSTAYRLKERCIAESMIKEKYKRTNTLAPDGVKLRSNNYVNTM